MRGFVGMLPWAVVLAIAGAVTWLLLERHAVLGSWVVAGLLVVHGLVHGLYLVPSPDPRAGGAASRWPFDLRRSWLVALAGDRRGRRLATGLVVAVVAALVVAALATVGVLPAAWWPILVGLGAVASLALIVAAFDVQLVLGIAIDVVLLAAVGASAWTPATS